MENPRARFSLKFKDEVSPYSLISTFVLPGEQLEVEAVFTDQPMALEASVEAGELVQAGARPLALDGAGGERRALPRRARGRRGGEHLPERLRDGAVPGRGRDQRLPHRSLPAHAARGAGRLRHAAGARRGDAGEPRHLGVAALPAGAVRRQAEERLPEVRRPAHAAAAQAGGRARGAARARRRLRHALRDERLPHAATTTPPSATPPSTAATPTATPPTSSSTATATAAWTTSAATAGPTSTTPC